MSRAVPALVVLFAASGCARELEEEFATAVAEAALETPESQAPAREITDAIARTGDCTLRAEDAAAEAAARPAVALYPPSCVTKQAEGAVVHATFAGCTGPFGRVTVDGGLDASFAITEACDVHADIADRGDLRANGRALDYAASADVEVLEASREIAWNAHWSGTTRGGRAIEQTTTLAAVLDTATGCVAVASGQAQGSVDDYAYGWTVRDLRVCPGACPASGVVDAWWEGWARNRNVRIEFDGSATARVVGWTGREFAVDLVCEPAP
jgi:hypothetical protein